MFPAPELGALLIEAPLGDPTGLDCEPYMIRLVFPPDVLTVFGISLDIPAVVLVSLDPLEVGPILAGHVLSDIVLEGTCIYAGPRDPQF
jgi:hypothetical protein